MSTSGYVAMMRREHEPDQFDVLVPECDHESQRVATLGGDSHPCWFEDTDGNVRCCHPDCIEQDWYGDFDLDSGVNDYLNTDAWARYFYGDAD